MNARLSKYPGIQAIVFDAVGTLIVPARPVATTYREIGNRFGAQLSHGEVKERFHAAFQQEEELDRQADWRTSEARERERWRNIVAAVLKEANDPEACFQKLYAHFARPEAWRVNAEAEATLTDLAARHFWLGVASNFDHRLRDVLRGLPALKTLQGFVVSSEVGWRKPSPRFFDVVRLQAKCSPGAILFVGDDWTNDVQGASASGMVPVFFDPATRVRRHQTSTDFEAAVALPGRVIGRLSDL